MEILNLATRDKQDEILSNFPVSGGIKSVQRGTFVFDSLSRSVSVSKVDVNKSFLLFSNTSYEGTNSANSYTQTMIQSGTIVCELSSSSSIKFTRCTESGEVTVTWQLIEFN